MLQYWVNLECGFANSVLRSRPAGSPAQIPWATSVGKQKPLSPLMTPIETINFLKNIFLIVVIKNLNFLNEDISIQTFRRNERKLINTLFKLMVMSIRSTVFNQDIAYLIYPISHFKITPGKEIALRKYMLDWKL